MYWQKRINFTNDTKLAVQHGIMQFIAVPTPLDKHGSSDLQYVFVVAESISKYMDEYKVIVIKSTAPVGTTNKVEEKINHILASRDITIKFNVASNPEFLREGSAIADFMEPHRIIIGTDNQKTKKLLKSLYKPFDNKYERIIDMDIRSAELTKYASNAMLAARISFINEMANLSELLGADIEKVRSGIGSDPRIGYDFISPGCGYGGSCFPKDVKYLGKIAEQLGYKAELLHTVENVNNIQKQVIFTKINRHYQNNIKGKIFALWGLAFKPETDDIRNATNLTILDSLIAAGAKVQVYDPKAMPNVANAYPTETNLSLVDSME